MSEIEDAISSAAAARYLGVSKITMAVWRARSVGPPCRYSGSKPVYYLSELRAWQEVCAAKHKEQQEAAQAVAEQSGGRKRGRPGRVLASKASV